MLQWYRNIFCIGNFVFAVLWLEIAPDNATDPLDSVNSVLLTLKDAEVLKESIIDRIEVTLLLLKVLKDNSTAVLTMELDPLFWNSLVLVQS